MSRIFLAAFLHLSLMLMAANSVAAELICDQTGVCLTETDSDRYRQAEAYLKIESWFEAGEILSELYIQNIYSEDETSFLIANNYAVVLAKTGRPDIAALVLERYFKDLDAVGDGFENLMQTYEHLSKSTISEGVFPPLELALMESAPPRVEPAPASREMQERPPTENYQVAATSLPSVSGSPAAGPVDAADTTAITTRLNGYLAAWSEGNLAEYLGYYVAGRSPVRGVSFDEWLEQRRQRVTPERNITLTIRNLRFAGGEDGTVVANYEQDYVSSGYKDTTAKRLIWVKRAGAWLIYREVSL